MHAQTERILTELFNRLIKDKTILETKRLAALLDTLQVWGVSAIKLLHEVNEIVGADDTGSLIFDDTDESKLDIIYVLNTEEAILNFELSKDFIEFCDITDKQLEKLVHPILTYPLKDIEKLLESYGLDMPNDLHSGSAETFDSVNELNEENDADIVENSPISETTSIAIASPRIPSPRSSTPQTPPDRLFSGQSSKLRDRIPALDERISSVKAAATQPNMSPTLIITPSQRMNIRTPLIPGIVSNSNEILPSTISRTESELLLPEIQLAGPSTPSASRHGPQNPHDAFDFGDMASALSDVLATATPSRHHGASTSRHPHRSRFSHSPQNPRWEPDPRDTMQGFHNQYVGLQGEVFVSSVIWSR